MAPAAMSLTDNKCFYGALTKIKGERVDSEIDPGFGRHLRKINRAECQKAF
jgi:hypothetical protein